MKKYLWLSFSFLFVSLLAGCNISKNNNQNAISWNVKISTQQTNNQQQANNQQQTNNQKQTNNTQQTSNTQQANNTQQVSNQQVKTEIANSLDKNDIAVYIDKNCEKAWLQQCQPSIWRQQLFALLKWNNFKIYYIWKDLVSKIKEVSPTSPVMSIPASKLSLFWPQWALIKQQAKLIDGFYYIPLFGWIVWEENLCNDGKDNNGDWKIDTQDPSCYKMTVLTSNKCTEQYCDEGKLKNIFMGYNINILDIHSDEWKQVYEKLKKNDGVVNLPVFLFNDKKWYMDKMAQLIKPTKQPCKFKNILQIPEFKYDPSIEACATNCNASPACKKLIECNKSDKPKVELFVMSYCPFGTQAEKGILPAVNTLWNKIDFSVKFVNYSMHGKKEIDENNLQYCIQKEEPSKYKAYLTCFLEAWNQQDCIVKADLDMKKENACIENVKKQFKTEENFNNRASWLSWKYPLYQVYDDLNKKYGVQGSPTLVINGIKVQPASRSPQAYLDAICKAFKKQPAECKKQLSNQSYDPMFGWTQNGKAAPAGSCGGK